MRYFDAVVATQPEFYFPLQGNKTNYGQFSDEIDSSTSITYSRFPLANSSLQSVNLTSNTLVSDNFLSKLPYKIWKKRFVFECLFYPIDDEVGLFFTEDNYYVDEYNAEITGANVIYAEYINGTITVNIHNRKIVAAPTTHKKTHHVVIEINAGFVNIFDNGELIGSGEYYDFDLYDYELVNLSITGEAYVSNVAIYTSSQNIRSIISHYSYIFGYANKLEASRGNERSLIYHMSDQDILSFKHFEIPSYVINQNQWNTINNKNAFYDVESNSIISNAPITVDILSENFYERGSSLELECGLKVNNAFSLISSNESLILTFKPRVPILGQEQDIFNIESNNGSIRLYVNEYGFISCDYNNYDKVFSSMSSYTPTNDDHQLTISFVGGVDISILKSLSTVYSQTIADTSFNLANATMTLFSSASNTNILPAELKSLIIEKDSDELWSLKLPQNYGISTGYFDVSFNETDNSNSKVFWFPLNNTVSLYDGISALNYGDYITNDSDTLSVLLSGQEYCPEPNFYGAAIYSYPNSTITPFENTDQLTINGDFIPPILSNSSIYNNSPQSIMSIINGKLVLENDKTNSNLIPDWTFSNLNNWTFTNCSATQQYNELLSSGYGIKIAYSNQAPEVLSNSIIVKPSTQYGLNLSFMTIASAASINFTIKIDWYNASNTLLAQNDSVVVASDNSLSTGYLTATSPSTAKYCKIKISGAAASTGETIFDSAFFGESFDGNYLNNNSGFSGFSLLFKTEQPSIDIFSHQYDQEYSVKINSGILQVMGFNTVKINNVIKNHGDTISNLDGWNHISAEITSNGILRPSSSNKAYVGKTDNTNSFDVAYFSLFSEYKQSEYFKLFGITNNQNITEPELTTITLNNDNVVAVNTPWTIIT